MATEKEVKIGVETVAKGTGAKDTAESIKKLESQTKITRDTSKKLRQEVAKMDGVSAETRKEVNKMADSFATAAKRGNRCIERLKGLERQEVKVGVASKDLGNGIYGASKRVDDLGKSSERTGKNLARLAKTNKKAGKSSRNLGLATLAASQGIEDMQYGIRGVLNNIPGFIMMMGGTAGMAGVISIVAVASSVLYEQLNKTTEAIEEEAEATFQAELKKKRAREQSEEELEKYEEKIDSLMEKHADERDAINKTTQALIANQSARLRLESATLRRDILLVEGDDSLSELQKAQKIIELRSGYAEKERKSKETVLQVQIANNEKLAESLRLEIEKRQELSLQSKIKDSQKKKLDSRTAGLQTRVKTNREKTLPSFVKELQASLSARKLKGKHTSVLPPFYLPGEGPPKLKDDKYGEFVDKVEDFLKEKQEPKNALLVNAEGLKNSLDILNNYRKSSARADSDDKQIEKNQLKSNSIEGESDTLKDEVKKIKVNYKQIKKLEFEHDALTGKLESLKEENEVLRQSETLQNDISVKQIAKSDYKTNTTELLADTRDNLQEAGASAEELKAVGEAGRKLRKEAEKALKDGVVTVQEQAESNQVLQTLVDSVSQKDSAFLQMIQKFATEQRTLAQMINRSNLQQHTTDVNLLSK